MLAFGALGSGRERLARFAGVVLMTGALTLEYPLASLLREENLAFLWVLSLEPKPLSSHLGTYGK
jgi:hypothetical protein